MIRALGIIAASLMIATPLAAQDALPPAPYAYRQIDDPGKEARALALMHSLRCLVCDGQSIADSDAAMAGDMRSLVRTRIAAGEQPEAVRAWLIDRYGSMISYDPPLAGAGWLLWLSPILFGALAGLLLWRRMRPRNRALHRAPHRERGA